MSCAWGAQLHRANEGVRRTGTTVALGVLLLAACGSDEPERVIGLDEIVHARKMPGGDCQKVCV